VSGLPQIFDAEDLEPVKVEKKRSNRSAHAIAWREMHDLSFFRNNFESVAGRLAARGPIPSLDRFRELDHRRRAAISQSEQLKARMNAESAEIGKLRRQGQDTGARQEQVRSMKEEIAGLDEQGKALDEEFRELLAGIPNIPHETVPIGRDESANAEIRRVGQPPRFDFEPKAHWDVGRTGHTGPGARRPKITGARFAALLGAGAKLERALINFMLDVHTREHGYTRFCRLPGDSESLFGTAVAQVQGRPV